MKKHLTTSVKLEPSINIKPVKNTPKDIERAYNYIWDDKKDHPLYKKIVWSTQSKHNISYNSLLF